MTPEEYVATLTRDERRALGVELSRMLTDRSDVFEWTFDHDLISEGAQTLAGPELLAWARDDTEGEG